MLNARSMREKDYAYRIATYTAGAILKRKYAAQCKLFLFASSSAVWPNPTHSNPKSRIQSTQKFIHHRQTTIRAHHVSELRAHLLPHIQKCTISRAHGYLPPNSDRSEKRGTRAPKGEPNPTKIRWKNKTENWSTYRNFLLLCRNPEEENLYLSTT